MNKETYTDYSLQELEDELQREKYVRRFRFSFKNTIYSLITVAALAVLVAVFVMPVLQIYGQSMTPTLSEGNIVLSLKGSQFETGDIVAFYYNNKILVKRVIARSGEWVDIDDKGNVFVNGTQLNEPYVSDKAIGDECDIIFPYQVPESRLFVMGDHRSVSLDSRNTAIGCVAEEVIVGRIVFKVWPLNEFGPIS